MQATVATWNISGGQLPESTTLFDYSGTEQLDYYAEQLRALQPLSDVVCIQETHTAAENQPSLTRALAAQLYPNYHLAEAAMHPSHIKSGRVLGLGLIATRSLTLQGIKAVPLPNPEFPLFLPDGRPIDMHNRWLMTADFGAFVVATTHHWSLGSFGGSYTEGPGTEYAARLQQFYLEELPSAKPIIFAGDLNYNNPAQVMPNAIKAYGLQEVFSPDEPTRYRNGRAERPDHVLYSAGVSVVSRQQGGHEAEHRLLAATFDIADSRV